MQRNFGCAEPLAREGRTDGGSRWPKLRDRGGPRRHQPRPWGAEPHVGRSRSGVGEGGASHGCPPPACRPCSPQPRCRRDRRLRRRRRAATATGGAAAIATAPPRRAHRRPATTTPPRRRARSRRRRPGRARRRAWATRTRSRSRRPPCCALGIKPRTASSCPTTRPRSASSAGSSTSGWPPSARRGVRAIASPSGARAYTRHRLPSVAEYSGRRARLPQALPAGEASSRAWNEANNQIQPTAGTASAPRRTSTRCAPSAPDARLSPAGPAGPGGHMRLRTPLPRRAAEQARGSRAEILRPTASARAGHPEVPRAPSPARPG